MSEIQTDHARGCQGREYTCTSGYDDQREWQPIETAPKNTKVLAAYQNDMGNWRVITACYHTYLPWSDEYGDHEEEFAPEGWYEENDSSDVIYQTSRVPTHWMPLPSPPKPLSTPSIQVAE